MQDRPGTHRVVPPHERRRTSQKIMPHVVLLSIINEFIDLHTLHEVASLTNVIIEHGSHLGHFPSPMGP